MKDKLVGFPKEGLGCRIEQVDFPEDPQKRLGLLLASVNSGPKAVTALLLPSAGLYIPPYPDLVTRFKEMMSGTEMADVAKSTVVGYCQDSLCEIGLVAREYQIDYWGSEKLVGFGLTDAGEDYGTLAAALALAVETKHDVSLYSILGASNTKSQEALRAPLSRALILMFLANFHEPVTEKLICDGLNLPQSVVADSFESLKVAGVVDYKSISGVKDRMKVRYKRTSMDISEATAINQAPSFTRRIAEICNLLESEGEDVSIDSVINRFSEEERLKRIALRINISTTLSGLANQGYLSREDKFKGGGRVGAIMSSAKITPLGRVIVGDFLIPMRNLSEDEHNERVRLNDLSKLIKQSLGEYARKSAELYYPFSKGYKKKQAEANKDRIVQILSEPGSEFTRQDLARTLGVNENTVSNYLSSLMDAAILTRERKKAAHYYRSASQS